MRARTALRSRLTTAARTGTFRLALGLAAVCAGGPRASAQVAESYHTPYRLELTFPKPELLGDLERTERGDPRLEAEIPHAGWYSRRTLERWQAWGPPARHYPPLIDHERWPVERKRERVIAIALRYQGYGYQHHHIPDWEPPSEWPWKSTCAGHNGKGVDCSNLTGFVYNLGFGLKLSTDVHLQSEQRFAEGAGPGGRTMLRRIDLPPSYEDRIRTLKTGDLLFIRSNQGKVSHVVIWVGPIGRSTDDTPLVIDSHGEGVRDSEGRQIPCGVQIRPFRKASWYNHSASHALRAFPEPRN